MSSINGLGSAASIQPNQSVSKSTATTAAADTSKTSASDRLELSGASHLLASLKTNDIRADKVASIKAQIENGTYDADGSKLDSALSGLLDDIEKQ
jgi:flagellar biosynthesis anti-sigma factor FlgM